MKNKSILLLVLVLGLQSVPSFAGWKCPVGQPDTCINQVTGYNQIFQKNIGYYQGRINNAPYEKSRCANNQQAALNNKSNAFNRLSNLEGRRSEVSNSLPAWTRLYRLQSTQIQILSRYEQEFNSYFRQVLATLKASLNSDALGPIKTMRLQLVNEAKSSQDQQVTENLNLVISLIDEILSHTDTTGWYGTTLKEQLSSALARSTDRLNSKAFSALARTAVEGALSQQDLASLNLQQMLSIALIQAKAVMDEVNQNLTKAKQSLSSYDLEINQVRNLIDDEQRKANSLSVQCQQLANDLDVNFPAALRDEQRKLNQNIDYLNSDGCRRDFCTYETNESRGGDGNPRSW